MPHSLAAVCRVRPSSVARQYLTVHELVDAVLNPIRATAALDNGDDTVEPGVARVAGLEAGGGHEVGAPPAIAERDVAR